MSRYAPSWPWTSAAGIQTCFWLTITVGFTVIYGLVMVCYWALFCDDRKAPR